jgi:integrase
VEHGNTPATKPRLGAHGDHQLLGSTSSDSDRIESGRLMAIIRNTNPFGHVVSYKVRLRDNECKWYGDLFNVRNYRSVEDCHDAARKWEMDEKAKKRRSQPTGTRTFCEVAEEWFDANPAKAESTTMKDRSCLDSHIYPAKIGRGRKGGRLSGSFGEAPIRRITPADIQYLVHFWQSEGMPPSSVRRNYATVRAVFTYACRAKYMSRDDDPCPGTKQPAAEARKMKVEVVTAEGIDTAQFLRVGGRMGEHALMVDLALTGLRWSEIAGLQVGDLDLGKRPRLSVNRIVTRGLKGSMIVKPTPKSWRAAGTKALSPQLAERLSDLVRGRTGSEWVFPDSGGDHLHYSNWRRDVWLPALELEGLATPVTNTKNRRMMSYETDMQFKDLKKVATKLLERTSASDKIKEHRLGNERSVQLAFYDDVTAIEDAQVAAEQGDLVYGLHAVA